MTHRLCLFALLFATAQAFAVIVRVATWNVERGGGDPASPEYAAVSNVLVRIDADGVALQELTAPD